MIVKKKKANESEKRKVCNRKQINPKDRNVRHCPAHSVPCKIYITKESKVEERKIESKIQIVVP